MKLNTKQYIALSSMLFGMFFGAGNLIFPALMGQMAGSKSPVVTLGFLITAVGLPLLGIVAMGISESDGLFDMASKVSKGYSVFFTCALYLTIGPLFAIPRTATVSFEVGIEGMAKELNPVWLIVFSAVFFAITLFFALRPSGILTWIGKIINPLFLVFLCIMLLTALINPIGSMDNIAPSGNYADEGFLTGFLEGYNTLDVLAGLAFGIVIIEVVKNLGVEKPTDIAKTTIKAGIFGFVFMSLIYIGITFVGAQSRNIFETAANGGIVLSLVAQHYFGSFGGILLAVTVILACIKTAISLVTSCAENFAKMFPKSMGYKGWAITFSVFSFIIANFGLNAIITWSLPVLMFLYPLAIVLILLNIFGRLFEYSKTVFNFTVWFTFPAAILDLIKALPEGVRNAIRLNPFIDAAGDIIPLYSRGLGWILPAIIGFVIGFAVYKLKNNKSELQKA